jgi:hypothetical protein
MCPAKWLPRWLICRNAKNVFFWETYGLKGRLASNQQRKLLLTGEVDYRVTDTPNPTLNGLPAKCSNYYHFTPQLRPPQVSLV